MPGPLTGRWALDFAVSNPSGLSGGGLILLYRLLASNPL